MGTNVLIIVLVVIFPGIAYAYVNPETGSLLYQVIIGTGLSLSVFLKLFGSRMSRLFRKQPAAKRDVGTPPAH